jgi:colanic acid/amylovoran biosynthesis glycosyltransferase
VKVGYVVKRYPRYSETFIVNEILAHEAAGMEIEIFSVLPPVDSHFQDAISRVRAPVTYLPSKRLKVAEFWSALEQACEPLPEGWLSLEAVRGEDVCYVYQAAVLAREARLRAISHLHAHFATVATTVARLAARFAGLPYTFTAHAKDIFHESVRPEDLRRKLADAAVAVTVSDYNLAYLHESYGSAARRVRRIYNGVDLERFPYRSPRERPPRIVGVGRLVEKKGFVDLIEACAILAEEGRKFTCRIVGAGEQETELRVRIARLGLEDRIELLGPRPQNELARLVQDAAVLAAPCVVGADGNRDGLPTVLLEAMALGTPCVSTSVTGIPEAIRDGETGLMVSQRDPAALAAAIGRLLQEPYLRERLADRARRLVEAEFDVKGNAAQLREMFHTAGKAHYASAAQRAF